MERAAFGFHQSRREGDDTEAINKLFTPEFRNRLDAVVPFSRLPKETISKVVDKFILQLEAQLADRNVSIELTDEARAWLVTNGYDEAMGARPMARVIQTQIKTPLADEVLFGRLKNGGVVRVVVTGDDNGEKQKLGFVYPEGPAQPRLERELVVANRERGAGKVKPKRKTDATEDPDGDEPEEKTPTEPQAT